MAANISIKNGKHEAAFALKPAWWQGSEKCVLDHVPDSETMIKAAGLDWEVKGLPISTEFGVVEGKMATVRMDTREHLGVVGDGYQIVQNKNAFTFLDSLLQDGIMRYESAGALNGGRSVWALARLPEVDQIAEGDTLQRYLLWLNNHDGLGAIHALTTSVRVVCQNTARIAVSGHKGIRHSGDISSKLDFTLKLLSQCDKSFTLYRDHAQKLAGKKYSSADAKQYIETLFPKPLDDQKNEVIEGRSHSIRERKVTEVRNALRNERQNLPSIKGSWWSLYNAVSEAVDHGKVFTNRGATEHDRWSNRFTSTINGQAADFKDQAFDLALKFATA